MTNQPSLTGEAVLQPSEQYGQLTEGFLQEREGLWVPRDGRPVWLGCGDEGYPTATSVAVFDEKRPDAMGLGEGYVSTFGQVVGVAKNVLVAQHMTDPEFYSRIGGIEGMTRRLLAGSAVTGGPWQVLPASHSARPQEQAAREEHYRAARAAAAVAGIALPEVTEVTFFRAGNAKTGCAHNMNAGRASSALANTTLYGIAGEELTHVFAGVDVAPEQVLDAHIQIGQKMQGPEGKDYVFGRSDYVELGLPTMVLQRDGSPTDHHITAAHTGVVFNFDPTQVRNARGAAAAKRSFYAVDLAGIALWAGQALEEYGVNAAHLMQAMTAEAVAVRSVLASNDVSGNAGPDPRRLAIGVRPGQSAGEALETIARLERQRY